MAFSFCEIIVVTSMRLQYPRCPVPCCNHHLIYKCSTLEVLEEFKVLISVVYILLQLATTLGRAFCVLLDAEFSGRVMQNIKYSIYKLFLGYPHNICHLSHEDLVFYVQIVAKCFQNDVEYRNCSIPTLK